MDQMLDKQDELLVEVKDMNRKFDNVLEKDIVELKYDMAEVKTAEGKRNNLTRIIYPCSSFLKLISSLQRPNLSA